MHASQLEQLLQFQRNALEMIALDQPTDEILSRLCLLLEAMVPNSVASIMQLDADRKRLMIRSAPSVPTEGIEARKNGRIAPVPSAPSASALPVSR